MTETKRHIEELKKAIPSLKERVVAVALLLALSLVMIASVSYAWVTMSVSPELGGVNTTVAANGALEIALVNYDGSRPGPSSVNDSFSATVEGHTAHDANITWGNMINLSSNYGIENLILRPSALRLGEDIPLFSVKYSEDGRVEGNISDFGFTTWLQTDASSNTWNFAVPELNDDGKYPEAYQPNGDFYGVRAISSVAYLDDADADTKKMMELQGLQADSRVAYATILSNDKNEEVITYLVQTYLDKNIDAAVDHVMNGGSGSLDLPDFTVNGDKFLPQFTTMIRDLYEKAVKKAAEAIVYDANLQMETYMTDLEAAAKEAENNGDPPIELPEARGPFTEEELFPSLGPNESITYNRNEMLLKYGVRLTAMGFVPNSNYDTYPLNMSSSGSYSSTPLFFDLYNSLKNSAELIQGETFWDDGYPIQNILWSDIDDIIYTLIDIETVTIQGSSPAYPDPLSIDQIANLGMSAKNYVESLGPRPSVVVHDGALKDFETLSGEYASMEIAIEVNKSVLIISVKYKGTGIVTTSVPRTSQSLFQKDADITQEMLGAAKKRSLRALDTYGMMLDLWVRTNAENTLLTLNGTPKYETIHTQLYHSIPDPNDSTQKLDKMEWVYHKYNGLIDENADEGIGSLLGKTYSTTETRIYKMDETKDAAGNYTVANDFYYVDTNMPVKRVDWVDTDGDGEYDEIQETDELLSISDKTLNDTSMVEPKINVTYNVIGYESANRVWTDEDMQDTDAPNHPPYLEDGQISATQGSGSCYIFYADSDEAFGRAKELLSNLKLVFLNSSGFELASARMDTDHIFSESGKHTVPIVITEESTHTAIDEEGNLVRGICPLIKNEATWLSVLVYLDGKELKNEMVMSEDEIIGSLNLQFDTTTVLQSVGDSELSFDVISLSAGFGDTGTVRDYTFNYGESIDINLVATVDGLSPTTVEAYFQRKVSASQGSRLDPVPLVNEEGTNNWRVSSISFDTPGIYVLNALYIDGVSYPLSEPLTVTVNGFAVAATSFDTSTVMTADRSVTRPVLVTISSSIQPESVEAHFMTEDRRAVTATLTPGTSNMSGVTWSGNATFAKSDTYTLQYLVMDGEYFLLDNQYQRTFKAFLGLTADVTLERYKLGADGKPVQDEQGNYDLEPLEYLFEGPEEIHAFVHIYDDSGKEMGNLGTITLNYGRDGSNIAQYGYTAELDWNGTEYAGSFPADRAGKFLFSQITVGGQQIRSARSAPVLSIIPKNPPQLATATFSELIVGSDNQPVQYSIQVTDADTAISKIVLSDGSRDYTLPLTLTSGNTYTVQIPDRDGAQDVVNSNGVWRAKELLFTNVYVDGKLIEADSDTPYIISLADTPAFTVVNKLSISIDPVTLGKNDSGEITSLFMDEYPLADQSFNLQISAPISGGGYVDPASYLDALSSAELTLTYIPDKSYGGYVVAKDIISDEKQVLSVSFAPQQPDAGATAIRLTPSSADAVQYAGKYSSNLLVTLANSCTFSKNDGLLVEVYSKLPDMKVTDVSPDSTFETSISASSSTAGGFTGAYNYYDEYYAVVYAEYATLFGLYSGFYLPEVELTVSDMANFASANAVFPNRYSTEDSDYSATYSFNPRKLSDSQGIGYTAADIGGGATLYRAGEQTVTELSVTYDTNKPSINVTLAHPVTIMQPISVAHVSFAEKSTSGVALDKVPNRIISEIAPDENGVYKFSVTLPDDGWTFTETDISYEYGDWVMSQGYPKTEDVYTQRGIITRYYTPYLRTTTIQTATTTTTTITDTHTVVGWRINGRNYDLGETVEFEFTGIETAQSITVQAILSTQHGKPVVTSETTTWTIIEFTQNGDESRTNPRTERVYSVERVDEKVTN